MNRFTGCGIHAQSVVSGGSEQMRHEGLFLPKHDLLVLQTSFRAKQSSIIEIKHFLLCIVLHNQTIKLVSTNVIVGTHSLHLLPKDSMGMLLA
jgi:hypothetical protein